jgi:hypothetical protein
MPGRLGVQFGQLLAALIFGRCYIDLERDAVWLLWQTIVSDLETVDPPVLDPAAFIVPDDLSGFST